ncbi:MAG: hypothetical protein BGO25_02850 [Acidobacteriales bacterium 59-55]|nr:MAG: hypothetical protein BGO25_02850 [Acidobacteriales bacterium 59-55]
MHAVLQIAPRTDELHKYREWREIAAVKQMRGEVAKIRGVTPASIKMKAKEQEASDGAFFQPSANQ